MRAKVIPWASAIAGSILASRRLASARLLTRPAGDKPGAKGRLDLSANDIAASIASCLASS